MAGFIRESADIAPRQSVPRKSAVRRGLSVADVGSLGPQLGFAGLWSGTAHIVFRGFVASFGGAEKRRGGTAASNENQFGLGKKHRRKSRIEPRNQRGNQAVGTLTS
jgi:hypothetical protein